MSESSKFTILPSPEKSLIDKKNYRVIKLENGLTAMLISDLASLQAGEVSRPQIEDDDVESDVEECSDDDMSGESSNEEDDGTENELKEQDEYLPAVAIRIGAGSLEDPKERGGLMHFLEHMLFMGSGKYPKESFFEAFIQKHGGMDNGFTELECTTYYFEIQEQHLKKGMDVFAQFFIDPLIRIEAIGREKKAVNSEYQLALPNDVTRVEQFYSMLANDEHPLSTFMWGNDETLDFGISDTELRSVLVKLWQKYYSSEHMTVAVQARESLDTLQEWVIEIFSKIPNSNLPRPTYGHMSFPWKMERWNKFYGIVPIREITSVIISWAMPSLRTKYKSKPEQYVSQLLADEGVGSILSSLMKRNLAVSLDAGLSDGEVDHNSIYCMFTINIGLTDEGFEKMDTVLHTVFQYLNLMRSVPPVQRIFEELRNIDNMDFNYESEGSASTNVVDFVDNMMLYPPKHYINGGKIIFDYEPEEIVKVLEFLLPEKCNIIAQSKKYGKNCMATETEKWFQIKYFSKDIPTEWKKMWEENPISAELCFPPPNPYVTTDFSLLERSKNLPEYPVKIKNTDSGELWYRQDQKFGLPKGACFVYWINEDWCNSAETAAVIKMFLRLFHHIYFESIYPMSESLFEHSLAQDDMGVVIKLHGFNQHFIKCLQLLRTKMTQLTSDLNEDTFNLIKKELLKDYHNGLIAPEAMNSDVRLSILVETHWQVAERFLALECLDMQSFITAVDTLMDTYYTKVLVQGNFSATEAEKMFDIMSSRNPASKDRLFQIKTKKLQSGSFSTRVTSLNQSNSNGSVTNYYQDAPGTMWTEVVNQFLMYIMSEQAFDFLRTKETLGYSVSCTHRCTNGILGFSITVNYQANKHSVDLVNSKMEAFLTHFEGYVKGLSAFEFDEFLNSFKKDKLTLDIALSDEMDRNWQEVASGEYVFDRFKRHHELAPKITKEFVLSMLSELSAVKSDKYRKLSVQIEGPEKTDGNQCPEFENTLKLPIVDIIKCTEPLDGDRSPTTFIKDLQGYRKSLDFYPAAKIL